LGVCKSESIISPSARVGATFAIEAHSVHAAAKAWPQPVEEPARPFSPGWVGFCHRRARRPIFNSRSTTADQTTSLLCLLGIGCREWAFAALAARPSAHRTTRRWRCDRNSGPATTAEHPLVPVRFYDEPPTNRTRTWFVLVVALRRKRVRHYGSAAQAACLAPIDAGGRRGRASPDELRHIRRRSLV
jgi:hypothetical protein